MRFSTNRCEAAANTYHQHNNSGWAPEKRVIFKVDMEKAQSSLCLDVFLALPTCIG